MPLTHEQIVEISRLQMMIRNLEKIRMESTDEFQTYRVTKDLEKYQRKIREISPDGVPDNLYETVVNAKKLQENPEEVEYKLISRFPVMKISPHSNDREINQIGTIVNTLDIEYMPILGDTHIKFDFAHQSERDTLFKHLENLRRNMKVLTETIEEYAQTEKQEFREQLSRMKNKQSRIFISESYDFLKKVRDFLEKTNKEIRAGNSVIMNLVDPIHFNPRFEKASVLEGKTIPQALQEFEEFVREAISLINLPNFKI